MGILFIISMILLVIIDIITTNTIIGRGGWEINPVMNWCMKTFGKWWFIPKVIITAIGLSIFKLFDIFTLGSIFTICLYIAVTIWNIKSLK